ncbi:MAG: DUF4810 domain-containing protein [bacterium]
MKVTVVMLFSVIAFGFVGCAPKTMYHWGNYENKLYKHYKNPDDVEGLAEALAQVIEDGEKDDRVPPGIYAEYGYLLLITGHSEEATSNFEKEKSKWPESAVLIDKMIAIQRTMKKEPGKPQEQKEGPSNDQ